MVKEEKSKKNEVGEDVKLTEEQVEIVSDQIANLFVDYWMKRS